MMSKNMLNAAKKWTEMALNHLEIVTDFIQN